MRTSRLAEQLMAEDAARPQPEPETNGQSHAEPTSPRGPRYVPHRSLFKKLFAKGAQGGCSGCQGEPWGWVQRQIQTPRRIVRFGVWLVTLLPRGWELARVVLSRRLDADAQIKRWEACANCESCVNPVRKDLSFYAYCGACQCPEWRLSRLSYKNSKTAWECPRRLHAGPYRGDDVRTEIARRQTEWAEAHRRIELPIVAGGTNG